MRLVQVSRVSGAGQCPQRRRSDFALLTCARNRHSGTFSGAGPHHQIGPAPFTSLTCSIHSTHLHHPPHPPAPLTSLTCTSYHTHPTHQHHPHPNAPLTCPHLRHPPVEESPAAHFPRGWVHQATKGFSGSVRQGAMRPERRHRAGENRPKKSVEKYFFLYNRLKQHKKHVKQHFFSTEPCFYRA